MKKYCCYCIRIKKNTTFNSVVEYLSANTNVSDESGTLSDTSVNNENRNSLLSALYTENPLHKENHCPITSTSNSFLPPRRNSSDELDNNNDDDSSNNSGNNSSNNSGNNSSNNSSNWTWRVVQ